MDTITDGGIVCIECLAQDCDCAEIRTGVECYGRDVDGEHPCCGLPTCACGDPHA